MRFRKKPVEIEATQFTREIAEAYVLDKTPLPMGVEIIRSTCHPPTRKVQSYHAVIKTLDGTLHVSDGDWIITGVKGERYPCRPDIFESTYEPVDHTPTGTTP